MTKQANPIFILGLPRTGTSLLLSILSTHKEIAGIAETWFLLPFLYANKNHGVKANYCHNLGYEGLQDLINNLPGKESQYNSYLKDFFDKIYDALAINHKYFIEKVPRYYYIIPEMVKLFPEARFIFIFRNPVQMYASRMTSGIGKNRFSIFRQHGNYNDILKGPKYLADGYKLLRDRAYAMNFESFVNNPEKHIKEILKYLDLEFDKDLLTTFDPAKLSGKLIDPNIFIYGNTVQKSVTEKWKKVFNTRLRKKIILKYVSTLGDDVLNTMGYQKDQLLNEIKELKPNGHHNILKDIIDIFFLRLIWRFKQYRYS